MLQQYSVIRPDILYLAQKVSCQILFTRYDNYKILDNSMFYDACIFISVLIFPENKKLAIGFSCIEKKYNLEVVKECFWNGLNALASAIIKYPFPLPIEAWSLLLPNPSQSNGRCPTLNRPHEWNPGQIWSSDEFAHKVILVMVGL